MQRDERVVGAAAALSEPVDGSNRAAESEDRAGTSLCRCVNQPPVKSSAVSVCL